MCKMCFPNTVSQFLFIYLRYAAFKIQEKIPLSDSNLIMKMFLLGSCYLNDLKMASYDDRVQYRLLIAAALQ